MIKERTDIESKINEINTKIQYIQNSFCKFK